ncbi:c-type cytochrome [Undibacterium terreum]|uniref:Cytochrome c n=1 Tax=Undibacterium terreum TaxID=1224302 RepID=A0A916UA74_9BURK|nr:cytochrome c family protein [Undibacterium terreum]GGC65997.1 cytochrome c [Undibacterium terreum]
MKFNLSMFHKIQPAAASALIAALALLCQLPAAFAADNADEGKRAFAKCASCHQVGPSARAGFGPALNGIIGKRAGSSPDYRYSAAMKKSGIVWTEKSLAAFLKDPGAVVPDTKMRFYGISDEKEIAKLLAYLKNFP